MEGWGRAQGALGLALSSTATSVIQCHQVASAPQNASPRHVD